MGIFVTSISVRCLSELCVKTCPLQKGFLSLVTIFCSLNFGGIFDK